jgi:O-antigen ligase
VHQTSEGSQSGHFGDWRGVFTHKNSLGQVMAAFFAVYLFNGHALFRSRALQVGAAVLTLLLVVQSRSVAALAIVAIAMGGAVFLFMMRSLAKLLALLLLLPMAVLVLNMREALLAALGRASDLSGRTEIWSAAYRVFMNQPLYGYGYGSATLGGLTAYLMQRFKAQNTHNGYIDLALSTGALGSLLFYAAIGMALYRAARAWDRHGEAALLIRTLVIFLIGWAAAALSEVALRPNMAMGAFGIAAVVLLSGLTQQEGRGAS